ASALDAERIGRGRNRARLRRHSRHVLGARHRIIGERAGDQLSGLRLVKNSFQQGFAYSLDGGSVQLALEGERVDDGADVVDRGQSADRNGAGVRIDFDLADHAAVWIGVGARMRSRAIEADAKLGGKTEASI